MAAKKKEKEDLINEEVDSTNIYENRAVYNTGFRNINTIIGARIYDEDTDQIIQVNRGILSGSWVGFAGVSHSGKTTLCLQMIANMMRPFIGENNYNPRVKLYIMDVENGVNRNRFKFLTGWTDQQIARHVRWAQTATLEGLIDLLGVIIKEKEDKNYKPDKVVGAQGKMVDVLPPTFIMVDAISELSSEDVIDPDAEVKNTVFMRKGWLMTMLIQKYRQRFNRLNINFFTISHTSKNINMDNPMAKPIKEWKGLPNDIKISGGSALMYATDLFIYIKRIEASDETAVERKGAKSLGLSSIMEAIMLKNRQGSDNATFYLGYDAKRRFDPLGSFLYECQADKILEASAGYRKIRGTELKVRSDKLIDEVLTNTEFREALFNEYDNEHNDQLESARITKEERQKFEDIVNIMGL